MIYLHRYTATAVDIAAVETEAGALAHEARGFVRCGVEAFMAAWAERDEQQIAERPAPKPAPAQERAVGEPNPTNSWRGG